MVNGIYDGAVFDRYDISTADADGFEYSYVCSQCGCYVRWVQNENECGEWHLECDEHGHVAVTDF